MCLTLKNCDHPRRVSKLMQWFVCLALFSSSGCAYYRHASVQVVDTETGEPIENAVVATYYVPKPFSLAARNQEIRSTDRSGIALLNINCMSNEPTLFGLSDSSFTPSYCVEAVGYLQTDFYPSPDHTKSLQQRSRSSLPSKPDFVIQLTPDPSAMQRVDWYCKQPGLFAQFLEDCQWLCRQIASPFRSPPQID